MASEEPSTNHLVMSPFWILRALVDDNINCTRQCSSSPLLDGVETLAAVPAPPLSELEKPELRGTPVVSSIADTVEVSVNLRVRVSVLLLKA